MTKGITGKEPNPQEVYADIINLPHHQSRKHPHMSLHDRAAQFAPFAALSGYDEMIQEESRLVDRRIEPGEEELRLLNHKLSTIAAALENGDGPVVTITYFVPDPIKAGGSYQTVKEAVKRINPVHHHVILANGAELNIGDILDISGEIVDSEW